MTEVALADAAAETIVRLAAAGDRQAFARLVEQHSGSMSRVAYAVCGDPEMTLDAVQSAWLLAWRRLGSVREPAQVRSWLVAVAANEARQAIRRARHRPVVDLSTVPDAHPETDPASRVSLLDLQRTLRALKPDDRSLLALRYVAGLDATELARHLGGSASGIRSRLARLLERVRRDLGVELEDMA